MKIQHILRILKQIGGQWLPITFLLIAIETNAQKAIKLPFFDDFSTSKNFRADEALWEKSGGVYVNNSLATTQPTVNIATFDGRNAAGIPYNLISKFATGESDTLTSKPIDLLTKPNYYLKKPNTTPQFTAKDELILSFYWLAKGLGELPDPEDSLKLEFLDNKGIWRTQLRINVENIASKPVSKEFTKETVLLKDAAFFHEKFQFRFISIGRQSGPFDNWHIDYVKLDTKENLAANQGNDFAVKNALTRLFKNYTAMPLRQFLVNPAKEMADSVKIGVVNIASTARNISGQFRFSIIDQDNKVLQSTNYAAENLYDRNEAKTERIKLNPLLINGSKATLKYKFEFDANDDTLSAGYKANNRVEAETTLDDYFAYDDGTAEFAAEVEKRLGKVAIQFILRKPDNIHAVWMNFTPFFRNAEGENFILQIMDSKKGRPNVVLSQQVFKVKYPETINGLVKYMLSDTISVRDTFYVAWTKIAEPIIPIGFDKNTTDFSDKIFYSTGTDWVQNTDLKGAFLVRPVMVNEKSKKNGNLLANEETLPPFIIIPNPTTGLIKWQGRDIKRAEVYDVSGRLQTSKLFETTDQQELNLQDLPPGQYLIRFFGKDKEISTKRVLVMH